MAQPARISPPVVTPVEPVAKWNPTVVGFMVVVHTLAISALLLPIRPVDLAVALAVYITLGLGTTVGLHRLICHRAFQCPRWVEHVLVTMAMPTGQGSPLLWAATHRQHHAYSDTVRDPHSPTRSLWYAHLGWILDDASTHDDDWQTWCKDIARDRYYLWLLKFRMVPHVLAVLAVALTLGWRAVPVCFYLPAVLWMHSTYAVNSLSHRFGSQAWPTGEGSRNFWLVGLLALGEGWHNNHHAFPRAARHGLRWWQLDASWWFIRALELVGLAWDLKQPGRKVAGVATDPLEPTGHA
jgi:fatty-acid desaturase